MSKITNDGLNRSGTGCFLAVPIIIATVGVKGLSLGFWAFIRQMADAYYGHRVHAFTEGLIKQSGSNVAPKFSVLGLDVTLHNLRRTG